MTPKTFDVEVKITWGALVSIAGKPRIFVQENKDGSPVLLPADEITRIILAETKSTHKCIYMPDGYILRKSRGGDWFYCHLGDSQLIVEFCPHCGLKLEE